MYMRTHAFPQKSAQATLPHTNSPTAISRGCAHNGETGSLPKIPSLSFTCLKELRLRMTLAGSFQRLSSSRTLSQGIKSRDFSREGPAFPHWAVPHVRKARVLFSNSLSRSDCRLPYRTTQVLQVSWSAPPERHALVPSKIAVLLCGSLLMGMKKQRELHNQSAPQRLG